MSQDNPYTEPRDLYARKVETAIWAPGPHADLYLLPEKAAIEWRIRATNDTGHLDNVSGRLVEQIVYTLSWIADQNDILYDWLVREAERETKGAEVPIPPPNVTIPNTSIRIPTVEETAVGDPGEFDQIIIPGDYGKLTLKREGSLLWEPTILSYDETVTTFNIPQEVAKDAVMAIGRLVNQFVYLRNRANEARELRE